ncbi:MAG: hypothetical protein AAGH48_05470 [Pseudomonadota bacterium]
MVDLTLDRVPFLERGQSIVNEDGTPKDWFIALVNNLARRTGGQFENYPGAIIAGRQELADVNLAGQSLTSSINALNASVITNSDVIATVNGQLAATWGVTLDVNGNVGGLYGYNDGQSTAFRVSGDLAVDGTFTAAKFVADGLTEFTLSSQSSSQEASADVVSVAPSIFNFNVTPKNGVAIVDLQFEAQFYELTNAYPVTHGQLILKVYWDNSLQDTIYVRAVVDDPAFLGGTIDYVDQTTWAPYWRAIQRVRERIILEGLGASPESFRVTVLYQKRNTGAGTEHCVIANGKATALELKD